MPDPDLYGVFREETSHTVGDPYKKKTGRPTLPRHSGKQFVTIFPQSGKLPESFIDKNFKRLSEGDLFVDPSKTERNLQQRGGTNVSTKPFVPSNPSRKNTGPGAIDGCIGNVILSPEGEDEAKVKARNAKSDAEKRKKIYSSPAQKGGFGYPSQARTIGGNPPEYMADKYQFGRELEKVQTEGQQVAKTAAKRKSGSPAIPPERGRPTAQSAKLDAIISQIQPLTPR
ncbi:hypothetical protein BSKO_00963 [Bryopsis sp. KO-2023]|nr:hypothetical protein BSKO_00963 [Bryopsis sp. KO-2023]